MTENDIDLVQGELVPGGEGLRALDRILAERDFLREFHRAHDAVENATLDYSLHAQTVDRLRRAHEALH